MKLLIMIACATAVVSGLLCHYAPLIIAGAVIHLACGVAELFQHYRYAKLLRSGTPQPDSDSAISVRVTRWIERTITLTGLVLVVVTQRSESGGYAIAGWIIWGGAIICYFVSGIITREVGGVPLSMGYGGWKVRRDRKGGS